MADVSATFHSTIEERGSTSVSTAPGLFCGVPKPHSARESREASGAKLRAIVARGRSTGISSGITVICHRLEQKLICLCKVCGQEKLQQVGRVERLLAILMHTRTLSTFLPSARGALVLGGAATHFTARAVPAAIADAELAWRAVPSAV